MTAKTTAKKRKAAPRKKAKAAKTPEKRINHLRIAGYVFAGAAVVSAVALAALFVDIKALPSQIAGAGETAVRAAGLKVDTVAVAGAQRFTYQQIETLAGVDSSGTIFTPDLDAIQTRLEDQTWIKQARVSRHLPGTIQITVEEHQPFARWQQGGKVYLIDEDGTPYMRVRLAQWRQLPLVVGEGANTAAHTLAEALEAYPYLASRLTSATRIGARRWDLAFDGQVLVRLPEDDVPLKLAQLSRMHARDNILNAGPMRIDMRMDQMLAISTDPAQFAPKPRPAYRPRRQERAS